jgi:hypothetical protein
LKFSQKIISQSFDITGLLLMIVCIKQTQKTLNPFPVRFYDSYAETIDALLKARIIEVVDLHITSLSVENSSKEIGRAIQIDSGTRRYGELISGIRKIHLYHLGDESFAFLKNKLSTLQKAFIKYIHKRVNVQFTKIKYHVYLINNFDHINTLFEEHKVTSIPEYTSFSEEITNEMNGFVSQEIKIFLPDIIEFVNNYLSNPKAFTNDLIKKMVSNFYNEWKKNFTTIKGDVMSYFPNFLLGSVNLKLAITEILYYYKRATDIIQENNPTLYLELSPSIVSFSLLSSVAKSVYSELL